jgi:hypothetical protein
MDGYIYKNQHTINETPEVWVIRFDDGSEWFGSEGELSSLLDTNTWRSGDTVRETPSGVYLITRRARRVA